MGIHAPGVKQPKPLAANPRLPTVMELMPPPNIPLPEVPIKTDVQNLGSLRSMMPQNTPWPTPPSRASSRRTPFFDEVAFVCRAFGLCVPLEAEPIPIARIKMMRRQLHEELICYQNCCAHTVALAQARQRPVWPSHRSPQPILLAQDPDVLLRLESEIKSQEAQRKAWQSRINHSVVLLFGAAETIDPVLKQASRDIFDFESAMIACRHLGSIDALEAFVWSPKQPLGHLHLNILWDQDLYRVMLPQYASGV